jgi:hypothetical protein
MLQVYDIFWPDQITGYRGSFILGTVAIAVGFGTWRSWPRPIQQAYPLSNTEIRIVEGDLFEQSSSVVIGMCTTFDTAVPHVISERSVQAQFLTSVYHGDVSALDDDLRAALAGQTPIGRIEKEGKTERYPLGTVASIRHQRRYFFCLAYTEMDERNEARGTVDGIWRSFDNLWREVRALSNGDPVAIPVVGGGQARVSHVLPAQDAVRLTALSFMLASRSERVCERLDIVVRKQDVGKLDMLEIRSFLASLRPSRTRPRRRPACRAGRVGTRSS